MFDLHSFFILTIIVSVLASNDFADLCSETTDITLPSSKYPYLKPARCSDVKLFSSSDAGPVLGHLGPDTTAVLFRNCQADVVGKTSFGQNLRGLNTIVFQGLQSEFTQEIIIQRDVFKDLATPINIIFRDSEANIKFQRHFDVDATIKGLCFHSNTNLNFQNFKLTESNLESIRILENKKDNRELSSKIMEASGAKTLKRVALSRLCGANKTFASIISPPLLLSSLATIEELALQHMCIHYISSKLITRLISLKLLDLSNNRLASIDQMTVLHQIPNLNVLLLDGNKFVSINRQIFAPSIKSLSLQNCEIRELCPRAFSNLDRNVILNIHANPLESVYQCMVDTFPNLLGAETGIPRDNVGGSLACLDVNSPYCLYDVSTTSPTTQVTTTPTQVTTTATQVTTTMQVTMTTTQATTTMQAMTTTTQAKTTTEDTPKTTSAPDLITWTIVTREVVTPAPCDKECTVANSSCYVIEPIAAECYCDDGFYGNPNVGECQQMTEELCRQPEVCNRALGMCKQMFGENFHCECNEDWFWNGVTCIDVNLLKSSSNVFENNSLAFGLVGLIILAVLASACYLLREHCRLVRVRKEHRVQKRVRRDELKKSPEVTDLDKDKEASIDESMATAKDDGDAESPLDVTAETTANGDKQKETFIQKLKKKGKQAADKTLRTGKIAKSKMKAKKIKFKKKSWDQL